MAPSIAVVESLFEKASSMKGLVRQQFIATIEPAELRAEVEDLLRRSGASDALASRLEGAVDSAIETLFEKVADPRIGKRIGRFEIRSILGDGGHTRVYLAFDPELQREVAIKVLSSASGLSVDRFLIEARAISALNHPHIGLVYEIGESQGGDRYLVMPLYAGPTLSDVLKNGGLPASRTLDITVQLAEALNTAHQAGIVHRDVKAANVIFESEESVRLLDFGIAKLTESQETEQNVIVGTVAYMSPEQTRGSDVDQRTDVWSLGVLLYEMLTGRKPFGGDRVEAIIHQIRHDEAPELGAFPEWLRCLVNRALAKDPAERLESMEAFLDVLNDGWSSPGREVDTPSSNLPGLLKARWRAIALSAVVAVTVGIYLLARNVPSSTHQIAVIPFENIGTSHEDDYLSEGISAQLRDQLGAIEGLSVVGRDSSREIRLEKMEPKAIAAALGARWLITGDVERQEKSIRLTVHIIEGESGGQVWTKSYHQRLGSLLGLQHRVIDDAVRQLGYGAGNVPGVNRIAVNSEAAFSLMLLANNYFNKALDQDVINQDQLDQSIRVYHQAIEQDPDSTLINSRLAAALLYRGNVNEAQVFIERAQAAGDSNSQVEHTLGLYLYARHADGVGKHLKRAVELNPSNADALEDYGLYLYSRADVAGARSYLERARELDPVSIRRYEALGNFYGTNGWYDKARQLASQIPQMFDSAAADLVVSRIYEVMGDLDIAIAWSIRAHERDPSNEASRWRLAELYTRIGDLETAQIYDSEQSVARLYFSRQYDEVIDLAFNLVLEDRSSAALFTLARAYAATDRADIVIRLMGTQGLPERLYRDSATLTEIEAGVMLADALMEAGQQEEARRLTDYLIAMFRQWAAEMKSWHPHLNLACLLSISGKEGLALVELEKIPDTVGLPWYPILRDQPCFRKRFSGNPRYEAVLESVLERKRQLRETLPLTLQRVGVSQISKSDRKFL